MGRVRRVTMALALCVFGVALGLATGCGGDSAPKIDSVVPDSGGPGSEVVLGGEMFGETQGASTVGFGTVTATVKEWSEGSITITVPDGLEAGDYKVSVTTDEGTSDGADFKVADPPAPIPTPTPTPTPTSTGTPTATPTPTGTPSP